ncbi:hypothetical protein H0G86_002870 [Trichoderma simmonsii]|uniref:Uncharacterized protein n=1 Tax=Trichoderma simmonsii TaxID=1491479 RepID=A0A8G0L4D6_9HYPO|nr:hypothetical protein H0G86_002870 [Trichoderma simmonsii]
MRHTHTHTMVQTKERTSDRPFWRRHVPNMFSPVSVTKREPKTGFWNPANLKMGCGWVASIHTASRHNATCRCGYESLKFMLQFSNLQASPPHFACQNTNFVMSYWQAKWMKGC